MDLVVLHNPRIAKKFKINLVTCVLLFYKIISTYRGLVIFLIINRVIINMSENSNLLENTYLNVFHGEKAHKYFKALCSKTNLKEPIFKLLLNTSPV